jgi:flagellum-specific ATP synthase
MSDLTNELMRDLDRKLQPQLGSRLSGKVLKFDGLTAHCDGFPARVGSICKISTGSSYVFAEVISFKDGLNQLVVFDLGAGIRAGDKVTLVDEGQTISVGEHHLGRVFDAMGEPLDGRPEPRATDTWPLYGKLINPLERSHISTVLDVGVRSINALLTIAKGQRVGIIAGSGVGKSVLLSMITKHSDADVIVVGLIGERSREVLEFVDRVFDSETRKKLCAVAVPADRSPLLRIRGANRATAIAEYYRDQGKNVLLIMDSLTRVAHARREIGLALGELPTSKGYPASVIALISGLIERAGMGTIRTKGSITGIYTVLADGDDANDPVVDTARAILDGHVVLNREYANMGIYPAIDISQSVSRVMSDVVTREHSELANKLKQLISVYNENKDLILMGGYAAGQDADLDEAYKKWPRILEFLKQNPSKMEKFAPALEDLKKLLKEG